MYEKETENCAVMGILMLLQVLLNMTTPLMINMLTFEIEASNNKWKLVKFILFSKVFHLKDFVQTSCETLNHMARSR